MRSMRRKRRHSRLRKVMVLAIAFILFLLFLPLLYLISSAFAGEVQAQRSGGVTGVGQPILSPSLVTCSEKAYITDIVSLLVQGDDEGALRKADEYQETKDSQGRYLCKETRNLLIIAEAYEVHKLPTGGTLTVIRLKEIVGNGSIISPEPRWGLTGLTVLTQEELEQYLKYGEGRDAQLPQRGMGTPRRASERAEADFCLHIYIIWPALNFQVRPIWRSLGGKTAK